MGEEQQNSRLQRLEIQFTNSLCNARVSKRKIPKDIYLSGKWEGLEGIHPCPAVVLWFPKGPLWCSLKCMVTIKLSTAEIYAIKPVISNVSFHAIEQQGMRRNCKAFSFCHFCIIDFHLVSEFQRNPKRLQSFVQNQHSPSSLRNSGRT